MIVSFFCLRCIFLITALTIEPDLIICDEAVSALDVSIHAQVLELLKKIKSERNLTYIFISHDLSVVEYISDRVAVMYLGKIIELANSEDLYSKPMHPYTIALLSAIPVADLNKKTKRIILKGDVPSPVNPPSGCSFHPRCEYVQDQCKKNIPQLKKYIFNNREHLSACHFAEQMNKNFKPR